MNANFDPYREALVVETKTLWPEQLAAIAPPDRSPIEAALHSDPKNAAQLDYLRLPTGFCRQITVTSADLDRLR